MTVPIADFDHNHFNPSHMNEADKTLLVKFFIKPRRDHSESEKQGRPIYKDVEYIDIKKPGSRDAVCRPATELDKQRFADHYHRFKERIDEDPNTGTPLTEWPQISRSMCEELAFFHVKTVEQLANMADSQVTKFMGLFQFRERARRWLEHAEKEKPLLEMEAKLAERDKEISELKESVDRLVKIVEGQPDEQLNERQKAREKTRAVKAAKVTVT